MTTHKKLKLDILSLPGLKNQYLELKTMEFGIENNRYPGLGNDKKNKLLDRVREDMNLTLKEIFKRYLIIFNGDYISNTNEVAKEFWSFVHTHLKLNDNEKANLPNYKIANNDNSIYTEFINEMLQKLE